MSSSRLFPAAALALALVLGTVPSLHAQAAPRPMTVVDLISLPSVADAQLSPDGTQVLYTCDPDGYGNVCLVDVPDFDSLPVVSAK